MIQRKLTVNTTYICYDVKGVHDVRIEIFWMDMSRIVVIVNPHSGKNKRNPHHIERFRQILGSKGTLIAPTSLDDLEVQLRSIKQEKIDVLCINGGDGTIHKNISILFQVYGDEPWPKLAILKGGTMNNIARNIGIPLLKSVQLLNLH